VLTKQVIPGKSMHRECFHQTQRRLTERVEFSAAFHLEHFVERMQTFMRSAPADVFAFLQQVEGGM